MNYIKVTTSALGLVTSLVCFVLLMISNMGTVGHSLKFTKSLCLMELNMNGIAMELLFPDFNNGSYADYGFAGTYYFGMYGYCSIYPIPVSELDGITYPLETFLECASSSTYEFDMSTFIEDQVWYIPSTNAEFNLPGSLQQNTKRTMNLSKVVYIFSILAIVFCFISMAAQLLYLFYGKGLVIVCCLKVFTFCFSLISSAAALGTYKYIADQINLYNWTSTIQSATLSTGFMIVTWFATGFSLVGAVLVIVEKLSFGGSSQTEKSQGVPAM